MDRIGQDQTDNASLLPNKLVKLEDYEVGRLMVLLLMVSVQMLLGSSIAAVALWLMVGRLMVLLLMVSVQMALGSSIAVVCPSVS